MLKTISLAGAALVLGAACSLAQESFDKPITINVAGTTGGGIDLVSRLLSHHLGKHILGKPNVIVQNMPGAGGIRAAKYLAEAAPKDGTSWAIFAGGPLLEPLIGARNPGYDMSQFNWMGAVSKDVGLCVSMGTSGFNTIDDARQREMIVAGTGAGSETDTFPVVLNEILHTRMKVITGYLGTKETILAMENGEAHGRCSFALSALKITRPDWLRDHKINILFQLAMEKSPELPDAPLVFEYVRNPADRQLLELMVAAKAIALPFAAPPGVPPMRTAALRRAFSETMKDPGFLAEARQMLLDVEPSSGEQTQAVINKLYQTPQDVVERAKKLLAVN